VRFREVVIVESGGCIGVRVRVQRFGASCVQDFSSWPQFMGRRISANAKFHSAQKVCNAEKEKKKKKNKRGDRPVDKNNWINWIDLRVWRQTGASGRNRSCGDEYLVRLVEENEWTSRGIADE
jgi:hypothetical protein